MNICESLITIVIVSSQELTKGNTDMNCRSTFFKSHYHGTTSLTIVQSPTNENPGINLQNGLSSEQSNNNSKKPSPLPAEYVKIKNIFAFLGNPDKRQWVPLCSINFEDMLNFPNFDIAFDEELAWLCNVQ